MVAFGLWSSALLLVKGAGACSYVEVPFPKDGVPNNTAFVIGRTMELGNDGQPDLFYADNRWMVRTHNRNESMGAYGFVSIDKDWTGEVTYTSWITEGMNERGFTGSTHTLRESKYEAANATQANDFHSGQLLEMMLRNCATVEDAKKYLETVRVVGVGTDHWAIADNTGRSLVIEYLAGQRVVYENPPRVMTNDPPLDFHWRNLNTYVNLNPNFPHQNDFLQVETTVGAVPRAVGHGWNLFGMPGDGSPPSRFVQLFYQRGYALLHGAPKSITDAMVLTTGLLNKVFIPVGTFASDSGVYPGDVPEYTPWAVLKVPTEMKFLFRGYRNLRWKEIDVRDLDFSVTAPVHMWEVEAHGLDVEKLTTGSVRV